MQVNWLLWHRPGQRVGFSKYLSTLDVWNVISQVSSQTKQVIKLHVPIKHIHKSLASVNEKILFYIILSSIVTQTKKQK